MSFQTFIIYVVKKYINKKMISFKEGYVTQRLLDEYGLGILTVLMSKQFLKRRNLIQNMKSLAILIIF